VAGGTYTGATATQGDLVWSDGDVSAKTITVPLNAATLPAGQSGTFNMEIFNATNASLETGAGASVSVLPLTVTVRDFVEQVVVTNPPAQPAPSVRSGGGGGTNPLLLLALAVLLSVSRCRVASVRAARSSRSAARS
jgi:hypothetical protein